MQEKQVRESKEPRVKKKKSKRLKTLYQYCPLRRNFLVSDPNEEQFIKVCWIFIVERWRIKGAVEMFVNA